MSIINLPGLKIPKIICTTESKYNGKIEVVQVGKTLKIIVGGILQSVNWDSPNARRLVWGRVLDVLEQNTQTLRNIFIMGLGGGTMQHLISKEYPNAHIVSVDIDSVMVDIARKYFDLDSIPNHRVIVGDACKVIIEPNSFELVKKSFHVALVDIYIGSKFPDLGNSGNFVAAVKDMVVPGGLVIFNRIYTENHQDEVNNFIDFIGDFLHDVKTLVIAGYTNSDNILIYGRT